MENYSEKSRKRLMIERALSESADLLCSYLQFANAHPVDFIINDSWNTLLPEDIQKELISLTKEELCKLPLGETESSSNNCDCEGQFVNERGGTGNHDEMLTDLKGISLDSEPMPDPGKDSLTCKPWKQRTIHDFLTAILQHSIEHQKCLNVSVSNLNSWLLGDDDQHVTSAPFVHAFMNEKKMHEVEIMADVCTRIFHKTSGDVVVDLGSGKGYLSTHLSLQCHLPVLGIDSQPHNTSGAKRRADMLGRQWDSLVKFEVRKSQGKEGRSTQKEALELRDSFCDGDSAHQAKERSGNVSEREQYEKTFVPQSSDYQGHSSLNSSSTTCVEVDTKSRRVLDDKAKKLHAGGSIPEELKLVENQHEKSHHEQTSTDTQSDKSNLAQGVTKSCKNQKKISNSEPEKNISRTNQNTKSNKDPGMNFSSDNQTYKSSPLQQETNVAGKSQKLSTKCVALTTYVSADTKLVDLVRDASDVLSPAKPSEDLRLFLTGLHTCGPLASNMLRLFVKDESVQAMCGVGCCYQLMQEQFSDDNGCWQSDQSLQAGSEGCCGDTGGSGQENGDFPMSSAMLQRKMKIGRKALDIASLALPRMTQSDGELQGKTFYPRALLQAFIHHKLGCIPKDMKKLRKLSKQTSDPADYVSRAIRKLNISGCEATEEEVAAFHQQHRHQQEKIAAFFQLRAALGPLVETVVLMDRLLFLLEQDCVEDAFLVRLFDPVTSPRCHALIATKKQL